MKKPTEKLSGWEKRDKQRLKLIRKKAFGKKRLEPEEKRELASLQSEHRRRTEPKRKFVQIG